MRHGACFVRYGGQGHDTDAHGCNKGKREDLRFGGYGAGSRAYFAFKLLCLANCVSFRMSCHRNQDAHTRSVHLWKSSSSCYVPISRYPILSSVRPVHAQPETDEEITEYVLLSDYRAPESFPAFTFATASGYVYRSNALDLSVPNPKCSIQRRRALPAPRLFGQFSADAGPPSGRTLGPVVVNNASSSDAIWELERELQLRLSLSSHHRVKCLRPPLDPLIFHQNVR